ncbi:receptor-like protein EIX2 [Gossypium arboreum]|uniref:receptor-like protein EIX2 n=1 Tax=Gossypium arboreum TaxID=29729 RepID=UPI0008196673|nr:receptor-like protein EIX2 [Gossypium arboreum]
MLRFEPNSSWIPPFQCQTIELGRWQLGLKFPHWLKFQKNLSELDISGAGISDFVPIWFFNLSPKFKYVNLSYNQLAGGISYLNVKDSVDFTSNRFTGPLPRVIPTLQFLILSNNSFSGSLFELVCHSLSRGRIEVLFIDKNLLTGEIPDCWNHLESLKNFNLGNNNLTGKIPPSLGRTVLHWLNLRNNSMFGELPSTLQNLTNLRILDLSENHFSGNIPAWIDDKLSSLTVLSLRSNNFDGYFPHEICDLQYLQNLDLSHNNIFGAIPNCLSNLSAMAYRRYQKNYQFLWASTRTTLISFSALLMLKGREDDYSATLGLVTSMDLSTNSLTGEIPKELGSLVELRSLNLSRNLLTGNIPDEIGNMELESLDLSMNQLNGEIPSSFSNLNFLNHFNVSYNNLTGQIPTSTQLQSFENFSYMGNHLCGPPLTKHCSTKRSPPDVANNGSSSEGSNVNWLYVSTVLGFVMGFWGVVAPLFFIRSWRHAYYLKLDHVSRKLYVSWATMGM